MFMLLAIYCSFIGYWPMKRKQKLPCPINVKGPERAFKSPGAGRGWISE